MKYTLAVSKDYDSFTREAQEKFSKRDKSSSKCISEIFRSENKLESPATLVSSKSKGISASLTKAVKSLSPKIQCSNNEVPSDQAGKFIVESGCKDCINNLITDCLKEGLEFDAALKVLEGNKLIKINSETCTNQEDKICDSNHRTWS